MQRADGENLPWLKAVVAARGWPGRSLVGEDGANAAWLLVQPADADPAFQRQCLDLLAGACEAGEATGQELAYLTDRVLLAEGQQQVYGSQVHHQNGAWEPRNLGDPENVDERRAAVGLGPLAEYLLHFEGMQVPEPPELSLKCRGCGEPVPFEIPQDWDREPFGVTCGACGALTRVQTRG